MAVNRMIANGMARQKTSAYTQMTEKDLKR